MGRRFWQLTFIPQDEYHKTNEIDPCPCGSGKKYIKCCLSKKKKRATFVIADFGKSVDLTEAIFDKNENELHFFHSDIEIIPIRVEFQTAYRRNKRDKVLNRSKLNPKNIIVDPNRQYIEYNRIFAVDTNSKKIKAEVICVTAIILCEVETAITYNGIVGKHSTHRLIEFRNPEYNAEKMGLVLFISEIMANRDYDPTMKIGIVTDHDLDNLESYNNHEKPLIKDYYLPGNFQLIYGSSDVGKKDYLPNILMSFADKASSQLLKQIEHKDEYGFVSQLPKMGAMFSYYRVWAYK